MIESLSHITYMVTDLQRSAEFLTTVFNAEEIYSSDGDEFSIAKEKFFLINGLWIAIMEGESIGEKSYSHVAFKISEADFDDYRKRVESIGLEIRKSRDRIEGEGRSLYFYDYDNHLFELHTGTLDERLQSYRQQTDPRNL